MKPSSLMIAFAQAALLASTPALASGGGGGIEGPNPLPQTPPAPDVVLRESFGVGSQDLRPEGDKGRLRNVYAGTNLSGFWVEYLGSWANSWKAPSESSGTVTWKFCGSSVNPNETLPSPMEGTYANGCINASWRDGLVQFPTALVPFRGLATPYEVSIDLYPPPVAGASTSIGLTASSALTSNLRTSGQLFMTLTQEPGATYQGSYEVRVGGLNGTLLASGTFFVNGFNAVALRVDPVNGTVSAKLNGVDVGTFAVPAFTPAFIAIEGQGNVDNLVVRSVP